MMSSLFTPYTLKSITLQNRFVMPAMQRGYCVDGAPTAGLVDYYRRRVEGGVGLIIGESCAVDHPSATAQVTAGRLNARTAPDWKKVVDGVREAGGHMLIQLWHEGAMREANDDATISPSGYAYPGRANGRAATLAEIFEIRDAFIASAIHAHEIGAHGVEVHACHGYLLDQFLWEATNSRQDGYGGADIADRARLPAEIVRGIREACGEDFVISFRMSQWKEADYKAAIVSGVDELKTLVTALKTAGVDLLHASTRRFWEAEWEGDRKGFAGWSRALANLPVIAVGSVGLSNDVMSAILDDEEAAPNIHASLTQLEERLDAGEFDLVAVGRSLIGDPDWVIKAKEGRIDEIRPFRRSDLGALGWNLDIVHEAHSEK